MIFDRAKHKAEKYVALPAPRPALRVRRSLPAFLPRDFMSGRRPSAGFILKKTLWLIIIRHCTRSVLLWNISKKSVRTGPAGRPRAKPHREISILAPFFEVQKMDISGAYSKQYRGYACSSGRLLFPARFRRPVSLVYFFFPSFCHASSRFKVGYFFFRCFLLNYILG